MSKKYRIGYIDEEPKEVEDFQSYFDAYESEIEVIPINPNDKDIEDIVDEVLVNKCDVIVIDFYLKYADSHVKVNGDELLLRIKERQLNLPLLIFTSRREEANNGFLSIDTLICDKSEINDPENPAFKNKIVKHIEFYLELKKKYKLEFSDLRFRQSQGEKLTGREKKRVIELNNLIEEMGDRQLLVTPIENQDEELEEINTLIDKTEKLIQKLENED
ncbi:hypothetical protein [Gaetbulibacter jejuensis]|uniref:hypothetical protein n=1 Tax=Gaetbulibacter jejuensis TaxID=584607 RepID=UPI00300BB60B